MLAAGAAVAPEALAQARVVVADAAAGAVAPARRALSPGDRVGAGEALGLRAVRAAEAGIL